MVTLPFDIHLMVVEWVRSWKANYSTLFNASLVCKEWSRVAQRLLFRHIPAIMTIPELTQIIAGNSVLGTYIRELELSAIGRWHLDSLPGICPNITSLTFTDPLEDYMWWDDGLERRRVFDLRPTSLTLNWATSAQVSELLQTWPSVRSLTLSHYDHENYAAFPGKLHCVDIRMTGPGGEAAFRLLEAVNEHSTLREIGIFAWPSSVWFPVPVPAYLRDNLLALHIYILPPADVLAQLTQLEELVVGTLPAKAPPLPRNVVAFGYYRDAYSQWIAPGLEDAGTLVPALSALPRLRMVIATRSSSHVFLEGLREGCRSLGVEIVILAKLPKGCSWLSR